MRKTTTISAPGKYARIFGLWVLFALGCWAAPFVVILYSKSSARGYVRRVAKAADRMLAAFLGLGGLITLSAECAFARKWYLRKLHDILNDIEPEHCEQAAIDERAYCKISDHSLGEK